MIFLVDDDIHCFAGQILFGILLQVNSGTGTQSNTQTGPMPGASHAVESNSSIGSSMNNDIMSRLNRITNLGMQPPIGSVRANSNSNSGSHMDSSGNPVSGTDSSKEHIGNQFVGAREPSGARGLAGQAADEWAKVMGDKAPNLFNPF